MEWKINIAVTHCHLIKEKGHLNYPFHFVLANGNNRHFAHSLSWHLKEKGYQIEFVKKKNEFVAYYQNKGKINMKKSPKGNTTELFFKIYFKSSIVGVSGWLSQLCSTLDNWLRSWSQGLWVSYRVPSSAGSLLEIISLSLLLLCSYVYMCAHFLK